MNTRVLSIMGITTAEYERAEQLVCNAIAIEKSMECASDNGSVIFNEFIAFLEKNSQNYRVATIKVANGFTDFRFRLEDPTPALLLSSVDNSVGVEFKCEKGCLQVSKLYSVGNDYIVPFKAN